MILIMIQLINIHLLLTNHQTIIMIVMIILLFYIIVSYVMGGPSAITSLTSAKIIQTIAPASLDGSSASAAANFTYSIWFYLYLIIY